MALIIGIFVVGENERKKWEATLQSSSVGCSWFVNLWQYTYGFIIGVFIW